MGRVFGFFMCGQALVCAVFVPSVRGGTTYVSGFIDTNTVWDTTGSPYIVIGDVTVDTLVRLEIEPGVEIKLDSAKCIIIRGVLNAIGSAVDSIIISALDTTKRWGTLWFKPASLCTLKYCRIEYAGNSAVYDCAASSLYIGYNTIIHNSTSGDGGGISSNGSPIITNNTITNNSAGRFGGGIYNHSGLATITNNIVSNNSADRNGGGIYNYSGFLTITNNIISNNSASESGGSIFSYYGSATIVIKYNTITDTTASAIYIHEYSSGILIDSNNLYATGYAVYNNTASNINARYNYWGTTDSATIANQRIWDYYDNPAKGIVYFWPFLPDTFGIEEVDCFAGARNDRLEIYPNPSSGNTVIRYGLSEKASISLNLYDITGRLVRSIYSGTQEKGYYTVDVGANSRSPLPKGIYFIKLKSNTFASTKKLIILE